MVSHRNTRSMKLHRLSHLLSACVLASLPLLSAKADFGSADTGSSVKSNQINSFDAWCGRKGNGCKIEIDKTANNLTINSESTVSALQITNFNYSMQKRQCMTGNNCLIPVKTDKVEIDIEYIKKDGSESSAKILFGHLGAGKKFISALSQLTGINPNEGAEAFVDTTFN